MCRGGVFMRRGRVNGNLLGLILIAAGATILLAMVLPAGFWWFILGMALIVCGCWLCRR